LHKFIIQQKYKSMLRKLIISSVLFLILNSITLNTLCQNIEKSPREHLLMDFGWKFSMGHSGNFEKDFYNGTSYFTYFAKAGYGNGIESKQFDDRNWRILDLPHDWAVELPMSWGASHSHGYINLGWKFPENSVGWYRKTFKIPESDLGRRISVQFDGVFRNAIVWVNGFYLGQEKSGYAETVYDITDYLNYGGNNVITVRVDATIEEGWFYEGAGIYRHVWLNKTNPLHVAQNGTFIWCNVKGNSAIVNAATTIINNGTSQKTLEIEQSIIDASGKTIASGSISTQTLNIGASSEYLCKMEVLNPQLWSLEAPYLHKLLTVVKSEGGITDTYETTFGIRTVRFDANEGFFLNGKHIKIKGTNNHQDHAGLGAALPDAMQDFRIAKLKEMGSNAYRCSHNPPTPELLDACDRLGMLVMPENRLMGCNQEHFDLLKRMIMRDRNHPSVILWSLGNEEWGIEGNITGARIASTMQAYAQTIDSTRRFTTAISGGWGAGISTVIDVMGFNYLTHGSIDNQHKEYPNQPAVGTEESTTSGTRGVYFDDRKNGAMAATDYTGEGPSIETGWKYYDERPFLAGLFYWTGFDYRGEPNPLGWPAVGSQFGIIDQCGFPKDVFYYLKSVWTTEPVLHIFPHWNYPGKEGQEINVWAYSNCDEVELFLNKKSIGKKSVPKNSHLEWKVTYEPGKLLAKGFKAGKLVMQKQIETTGDPKALSLQTNKTSVFANGEDVAVITVSIKDVKGQIVPVANNDIAFSISGKGKIIGVGNGDPASHEPDKFIEEIKTAAIKDLKQLPVENLVNRREVQPEFDDSAWKNAFEKSRNENWREYKDSLLVVRGTFELPDITNETKITLFTKSITENMSIYVNGVLISANISPWASNQEFLLDHKILKSGKNVYAVTGQKFRKRHQWDEPNTEPGVVQVINPVKQWNRKVFNGLAQVIVQAGKEAGEITLTATSNGLIPANIKILTTSTVLRPAVPEK
jgi:beta-galactosidase